MASQIKNPFENLFGGEGGTAGKDKTKSKTTQNPFEGLFEAKQEVNEFGLPKTTISKASENVVIPETEKKESFWKKAVKAVLPKKLEDFFGLTDDPEAYTRIYKSYEQAYAKSDLTKLQKEMEAGGGKLPEQNAGDVLKEKKPEEYLPFVSAIPDIVNSIELYQSAKRLEKGEETMVDIYRLTKFKAEQERDKTFMAKVTSVLTELPSFGAELLLTGGVFTGGKKATEKAVTETLEKVLGKKVGSLVARSTGSLVGGTLQTVPARGLEITAGTVQNMIPDYEFTTNEFGQLKPIITGEGDDLWKALIKSGADQWVEVVSEHSGGLFNELAAPIKNQILKIGILKTFLKSNPTAKSADFMKWVNRAGWNGVLAEMFEERVGEFARGTLSQLGLSEEGWKLPSKEQLAVELVSFSVPGVMISTSNKILQSAGGTIQEALTTKETDETKAPITEAEGIIGARDILIVGKGGTDLNVDAMTVLNNKITNYHNQLAETVVDVLDIDKTNLASIKVVPYPDGKWGYSFDINTPEKSISSDFLNNRLSATRAEAIASAKEQILKYSAQELPTISESSRDEFQTIISHIKKINPELGVPVEVRKGEITGDQSKTIDKVNKNIEFYIQTGKGEKGDVQPVNAALRDLETLSKDKVVIEYTQDKINEAIADGIVNNNKDGTITLWRAVGEKKEGIVSASYIKERAQGFQKVYGGELIEVNVKPEDIKIFIGGKEGEVLINLDEVNEKTKTQKEKVAEAVKEKPKTIKEIADETKILEPNVRRILGVGTKEGTFERIDKGVYVLRKNGKDIAFIHTGDAVDILPRLAFTGSAQGQGYFEKMKRDLDHFTTEEREGEMISVRYPHFFNPNLKEMLTREQALGEINEMLNGNGFKNTEDFYNFVKTQERPFKADMVFLDIPYKTPSVTGGNRGAKFDFITVEQFGTVVEAVKTISRDKDTPVFYMFSQAPSGMKEMQKYTDQMTTAGFKPVARGEYTKLQKDGITRTRNMRGVPDYPEGIILFTQSGNFDKKNPDLNFKLIRPKGYQTEKPAELAKSLIEMATEEGEIVLDPFAGSGVVPAEAVKAGRKAVAIEKSEKAVEENIKPRIEEAVKETPKPRFSKGKTEIKIGNRTLQSQEIAARVMPKKSDLPILNEFKVKDGKLVATDLNVSLRLNSALKDGMYKVVGKDAVKTNTDPADYPVFPEVEGKKLFEALTENLSKVLKNASLSVFAKDGQGHEELKGILIKVKGGIARIISTDSFRLYVKSVLVRASNEGEVIISEPEKVQKVITAVGGVGELTDGKDFVNIGGENGDLAVSKQEGKFPEINYVYPNFTRRQMFDKKQFIAALKELKPFAEKFQPLTGISYGENEITLTTESGVGDSKLKKSVKLTASRPSTVDIKEGSINDGVLVMSVLQDEGEKSDIKLNINFMIDALNALDEDAVYFYSTKEKYKPVLLSNEAELKSDIKTGVTKVIEKGTKLFHGTSKVNAAAIISDRLKQTEDETATYGKAVYLTPDYTAAQDYANEQGEGQVITIKPFIDLRLYQPSISERDDLIDKIGKEQDELIKKILPKGYSGFYIPDDGRGDGGEQVILYDFNYGLFEKPELADEVRSDSEKTMSIPPKRKKGVSGVAATGGANIGDYEDQLGIVRGFLRKRVEAKITPAQFIQEIKKTFPNINETLIEDIADKSEIFLETNNPAEYKVSEAANYIIDQISKTPIKKETKQASGIASVGGDKVGNFEDLAGLPKKSEEQFKLFEEVKALIKKYANTIGEDYLPRNALGVYYPETTNIRIKGLNHLSVAAHEITHFLDFAYKISDQLMGIKGYAVSGNPIYESETSKIRKEMTDLYEKYYPGGSRKHPLRKRMLEGFATLLEKYTEQPSTITAEYPNLVKEFLIAEGKYYNPVMGDIIRDLREIVSKYQGLPALDKVGARVINDEVNVNKDSFLNFFQKFKNEIADTIYPEELLAKKAGVHFTKADPSLWLRQYNNSNTLILNNINGNRGFWGWRNGELSKLHDFNWKDLIKELHKTKTSDAFAYWLVARREYFIFQEINKLKELENPTSDDIRNIEELQKVVSNDGFTEKEVSDAYLLNKEKFADYEKKFDTLVKEDLNFLNDPSVGLVDNEEYKKLTSKEGYASFKRYFYDEVVGEEEVGLGRVRFGSAKVSSLLKRTGSQKPIFNPLYSSLKNHAEATRKGLKQIVYNKNVEIAIKKPEIGVFQRLQLKGVPDRQGRILFPQEKDPNIIMGRINYKRVPVLVNSTIKRTIDEVLNFQNISIFEKLLMGSSRFFTKGTTGLFPGFALTNYTVDQVTAMAQTRENYKVLYDPLKTLNKALRSDRTEHVYLQEYLVMGGERQTFVGWQDMSPNELFDAIGKERKGLLKAVDYLNSGMNILAIPSQWSEIMTRATEYIKAREAGKTPIVALEEAGRITAPFHHIGRFGGGRIGQTFIKSIPFFNPSIQVLAQAAETLETPAGRQRYAFVTLAITAASIGSLGLIMAYGSDDQKRLYADINPDELNKYIWLPDPDGKKLIKIRVPDQMAVFATLVNMAWADKSLKANYQAGEYLAALTSWLPQQFDISQPSRMLMSWIPQIIKPGVLTLAGVKDFPKIMPLESQMLQNRAPGYRYNEATSPLAKWLGKTFNLSPIKIDYLLTGYVGRASGFFTGKPDIYNPFKSMSREYYFTSGRKVQSYYDLKEKNDQDYEAYKNGRKDYSLGERTAILKLRSKLKIIDSAIGLYRDTDEEKYPEKAEKLKNRILKLIDEI